MMDDDDLYDGPAVITAGEFTVESRVRLIGFFNPLDGKFHWQGTIYAKPEGGELKGGTQVTIAVGETSAPGRITEQTPWGHFSVTGVGAPPYPLAPVEVEIAN